MCCCHFCYWDASSGLSHIFTQIRFIPMISPCCLVLSPLPANPGEERRYPHDTPLTPPWYPSDMPCLGMNFDHAVATKNDVTHFSRHRRIWCWPMLLLAGLRVSHHVGALSWEVPKLSSKLLRLLVPTKQGWIQLIEPARMEGTTGWDSLFEDFSRYWLGS